MMIFTHKSVKIHKLGNKVKNCRPHYEKLKPLKSGFKKNSNFENNRDPCIYEITAPCVTSFLCYLQVPFLGCVPLEPQLALAAESGSSFVEKFSDSKVDLESLTISPGLHV